MDRIEDELRRLFARRDPPGDFTARVMQRVRSERRPARPHTWQWVAIGAMAASLTVGVYVGKQRRDRRAERHAQHADQILESLSLVGTKINKARDAVLRTGPRESPE